MKYILNSCVDICVYVCARMWQESGTGGIDLLLYKPVWFLFSLRSPWSNKYDPPLDDGALPSDRLRRLEIEANKVFDTYREL